MRYTCSILLLYLLSMPAFLTAQDGTLDPSFSDDGYVTIPFPGSTFGWANDMVVYEDGRILIVGCSSSKGAIARVLPNGELDGTFSNDGMVTLAIPGIGLMEWKAVALQPDERIVVVGYALSMGNDQVIARYTPEGVLDTSFASIGYTVYDHGLSTFEQCRDVIVQPDGKIVVLAVWNNDAGHDVVYLGRYHSNGTFDLSFAPWFGGNGHWTEPPGLETGFFSPGAMIYRAGKIIVTGACSHIDHTSWFLHEVDEDGVVTVINNDITGGYVPSSTAAYSLDQLGDSSYIIAGMVEYSGIQHLAVGRCFSDGLEQAQFGIDGVAAYTMSLANSSIKGVVVGNDGNMLLAGSVAQGGISRSITMRVHIDDGVLDSDYGTDGVFYPPIGDTTSLVTCAAFATDDGYLIAGRSKHGQDMMTLAKVNSGYQVGLQPQAPFAPPVLYPVPAREEIHVPMDGADMPRVYAIMDMQGRLIRSGTVQGGTIPIRDLTPGVFQLRFNRGNSEPSVTLRFVKE